MKWSYIIGFFLSIFILCTVAFCTAFAGEVYIVVPGDTLSEIANSYKTTWQNLHKINPDIKDPNLIYPGQKINVGTEMKFQDYVKPKVVKPMDMDFKIKKLAKFMFNKSEIPYISQEDLEFRMLSFQHTIFVNKLSHLSDQRKLTAALYHMTRQYEIWEYAKAIAGYKDETLFITLVGLAWQECHFVHRKGKHGEVTFYQLLPSTVKERNNTDDVGLIKLIYELENNPDFATYTAAIMLNEYKYNWGCWNKHPEYPSWVKNKVARFKQYWSDVQREWKHVN